MSTEADEIILDPEVEVVDADAGNDPVVEVAQEEPQKTAEPEEKKIITPDEGVEALKANLEAAQRQAEEAQRRAADLAEREAKAQNQVRDSNLSLVDNAIATVNQQVDILERSYAEALRDQDFDSAAKIQREMVQKQGQLAQLEQGKMALEAQPKYQAETFQIQEIADPVERMAANLTPRSASWIRAHPEYARDARLTQKMLAAHNLVTSDGFAPDTDDYFAEIENVLKIAPRVQEQEQSRGRQAAPPAAPVSRGAGGGGSQRNRATLSKAEIEIAEMMNMTPSEYAKNKIALQKEGKVH